MKALLHKEAEKYYNRLGRTDRDRFDETIADLEKEPLYTIEPATPAERKRAEKRIKEYYDDPSSFVPFKKRVKA